MIIHPPVQAALNKAHTTLSTIDSSTQTTVALPLAFSKEKAASSTSASAASASNPCGLNRIQHASSLEPSVPCHALSSIVNVLNEQISLLLVS